jgi:ferredoxin-NADP reductase/predicted pyridoxine 5'-phosphate oxidase superfamily flavin-nucleotide-binding protein
VIPSPFHEGELAIQRRLGVHVRMESVGKRVIRDHMLDQHRAFFGQLPFLVVGAVDTNGDAWATLLTGPPGFATSPDARSLVIATNPVSGDPAAGGLVPGASVGLLGIELGTRRRNRLNGVLAQSAGLRVNVVHSFGNCPQYIQTRTVEAPVSTPKPAAAPRCSSVLTKADRRFIAGSDTFYVASYVDLDTERQVDVSHRGGRPGFVRVNDDGSLLIPDFAGNLLFNTLGNFLVNPRAGLVFVDWENGDVLQLTGHAEVLFDLPEVALFEGAERLWSFMPSKVVLRSGALPLRARFMESSPNSEMTGTWRQTVERLAASRLAGTWRPFEVTRIVEESVTVRSLYLAPADGVGAPRHSAGQHLPIRVTPTGYEEPTRRFYTLSVAPSDPALRLSVKRDGLASRHLHTLTVGDVIEAQAPAGSFTINAAEDRPAVLIAGGIGITPLLAMLRHITYEGRRTRGTRPTTVIYAARDVKERAFDAELRSLVAEAEGAVRVIRVLSRPSTSDAFGVDFEHEGRVGVDLLRRSLPAGDAEFFICGPPAFTQSVYDDLRALHVRDRNIRAEAFGPAALARRVEEGDQELPAASGSPVPVQFADSVIAACWEPGSGSLLELAEAHGLSPAFGCRAGSCGSCKVTLLEGTATYASRPNNRLGEGEVLLCQARPAEGSAPLVVGA